MMSLLVGPSFRSFVKALQESIFFVSPSPTMDDGVPNLPAVSPEKEVLESFAFEEVEAGSSFGVASTSVEGSWPRRESGGSFTGLLLAGVVKHSERSDENEIEATGSSSSE